MSKFLNLSFREKGIDERFDQVLVFLGEFFHRLELVKQFFIASNQESSNSGNKKKEPDADSEACKRSAGC